MGLIKIIKKAVTPMEEKTGHIYDTTNIDNKAENTYSANTIDGLVNAIKKTDTSNYIEAGTGFSILSSTLYRQGNRVFGNVVVKKSSGIFSGTQETVLNLKIYNTYTNNTGCFLSSKGEWNTDGIGYCYLSPQAVLVSDPNETKKYNIAKLTLDLVEKTS